jgi:hypothetical protein
MSWPHFCKVPSEEDVARLLDLFLGERQEFVGLPIKIGKTTFYEDTEQPGNRYGQHDRYEKLTDENILCVCATEEMSLQVEQMAQKIVRERGMLIQYSDAMDGTYSGDTNKRFCVYITKFKSELYTCPIPSCSVVATHEGIIKHRMEHKFVRFAINAKNMAIRNSLQPPKIVTSPVPVSPSHLNILIN